MFAVMGLAVSSTMRDGGKVFVSQGASHREVEEKEGESGVRAAEPVKHQDDEESGAELCLLGDAYKDQDRLDEALDSYKKAVWTESPDDVIQYALDSATGIMQGNKDWEGVAKLHSEFMARKPDSQLAVLSVRWVARMYTRMGKSAEATEIFATALRSRIGDPAAVQAEFLLDELVKSMVPRKRTEEIHIDELDQQLKELLEKIAAEDANATAKARAFYARARLAQLLKYNDRSRLFLKGIVVNNAKDLSVLSAALLSKCGDVLLLDGEVDQAETMYQRLKDHFAETSGDVAEVGLGRIALARKKPEEALGIFNGVLSRDPDARALPGGTVGKLQALLELNRIDDVMKLALEALANKSFKGEPVARIQLLLGQAYEKKADVAGEDARGFLQKAFGIYQRVGVSYQGFPDLRDEALKRVGEVRGKL